MWRYVPATWQSQSSTPVGSTAPLTHVCSRLRPAPPTPGVTPRLLKRTLQTALVWTLYEDLVPRITQLGLAARQAWEERSKSGGKD